MKGRMSFKMFTVKGADRKVAVNDNHVLYIQDGGTSTVVWMRVSGSCAPVAVEVKEDFDTVFSRLNTCQSSIVREFKAKRKEADVK